MRTARRQEAFTLIELIVVIGVIAALIALLLPILSSAQQKGRDLQCQSNIRECLRLLYAYAAENKGRFPYGKYYTKTNTYEEGWSQFFKDTPYITMWSIISHMTSPAYPIEMEQHFHDVNEQPHQLAPIVRCPEALQVLEHVCSYVGHFAAFNTPADDAAAGAKRYGEPWARLIERPTLTTQCYSYTALIWDTAVVPGMKGDVGYVTGRDLDMQRIWRGASTPQMRYLGPRDAFAQINPLYGYNASIRMEPSHVLWRNIDPPPIFEHGFNNSPYQGNLRFRHNRNTTCNVGYADGHVDRFTGTFKKDGRPISHDAVRKHFLLRWPAGSGIAPDPGYPY